ncbi:MAG: GNAT family N-acetyltransferase [Chloroflexi bacterium]|nr:GNAT family N-acetyltransferase [Chloroflexota bacterium]
MNNVKITLFNIKHYDDVIALWQQSDGVGLSISDSRERISAYLERNPTMSFIAKYSEAVIGAALCGHDGRRGYLHHLAVHPQFRRQGIGRQLASACLESLQAVGIDKCHLFIFHQNQSGIAFWQAIGWEFRQDIGVISIRI